MTPGAAAEARPVACGASLATPFSDRLWGKMTHLRAPGPGSTIPRVGDESAGAAPHARSRGEAALLALLTLVVLAFWASQYQPFFLPNNDFPSFERTARSLAAFELPKSFQRMPVFPALMAVVAPALPEPHPYLHAALLLNIAFSLGTLWLLFVLASRTFGRGALLVPLLFATSTQFHAMGLQPLVEPSLGFFVVLAFVLFERRSGWQWVAAFAAALSRYEAAMLIPVLVLADVLEHRRFWRPALAGALASSGLLLWAGLGALHGSGGSTYLDMMKGMGFTAAPEFLERSLKEPFRGYYRATLGPGLAVFAACVLVPLGFGIARGLRNFRRETLAMLGFAAACVLVIVVFGINKARYVYPTEWIWLFFFAAGVGHLGASLATRLAATAPPAAAVAAMGLALGVFGVAGARWIPRLAAEEPSLPLAGDLAFAAICAGIAVLWGSTAFATRPPLAGRAAGLALAALLVPLVGGGLQGKRAEAYKVRYASYGSFVAAEWLGENLQPGERALTLGRSHVLHLTGFEPNRIVHFGSLGAERIEDLAPEMDERGIEYAIYTWRKPLQTPSDGYYHGKLKAFLAEELRDGAEVPGLELVATLPLPAELERDPVRVYRLVRRDGS